MCDILGVVVRGIIGVEGIFKVVLRRIIEGRDISGWWGCRVRELILGMVRFLEGGNGGK